MCTFTFFFPFSFGSSGSPASDFSYVRGRKEREGGRERSDPLSPVNPHGCLSGIETSPPCLLFSSDLFPSWLFFGFFFFALFYYTSVKPNFYFLNFTNHLIPSYILFPGVFKVL